MSAIVRRLAITCCFSACLMHISAVAGTNIHIEKLLPGDSIASLPNTITVSLYASREATIPVGIQTYNEGEWQLTGEDPTRALHVFMNVNDALDINQTLWFEVRADGKEIGWRETLRATSTGVTFASGNDLFMDGNAITGLHVPDPPSATDAANVGYVDALISRIEALEAKLADVSITYDAASGLKTFNINNVGLNITSQSGHSFVLDDTPGAERISVLDKTGKNGIEISSTENSVTFMSDGDYIVDSKGKAILESDLDFTIDSGLSLSIGSSTDIGILPTGNLSIGGIQTSITPTAQLILTAPTTTISAGSMLDLDGGIITLN